MEEEDREMELLEAAKLFGKVSRNKLQKLTSRFIPHRKRNTKRQKENAKLENEVVKLKSKEQLIKENISLKKKNEELRAEISRLKKEVEKLTLIDRGILKEETKKQGKKKTKAKEQNIKNSNKIKEALEETKTSEITNFEEKTKLTNEKSENIIDFNKRKDDMVQLESKEPNKVVETVKDNKTAELTEKSRVDSKEVKITNTIDDLKLFENLNERFNVGEVIKNYGIKAIGEEKVNEIFIRLLDLRAEGYVEFKDGSLNDIKNAEFVLTEKGKSTLDELTTKDYSLQKVNIDNEHVDSKSVIEKMKNEAKMKIVEERKKNIEKQRNIQMLKEGGNKVKDIKIPVKSVAR